MITNWPSITLQAFQNVWQGVIIDFLPKFLVGLIVFIIGWILATGLGRLFAKLLRKLNFDTIFSQSGWKARWKTPISGSIHRIFSERSLNGCW